MAWTPESIWREYDSKGQQFENALCYVWEQEGYECQKRGDGAANSDFGIDIEARHSGTLCVIQAKCYDPETTIRSRDVRAFLGSATMASADRAVFATTAHFTQQAREVMERQNENSTPLELILLNGEQIANKLNYHL